MSFVVTNRSIAHIKQALKLLPFVDFAFGAFFFLALVGTTFQQRELRRISKALNVNSFPYITPLRFGLWISALLMFFAAVTAGYELSILP